ncbi:MAG: ATP-dependent Clp protease adaptor ClpS, partial [Proteobacteria bacterium]|nr:ATP-dependent Clp protease adaptor ClpS [Pseudomonadota bacterium]
MSQERDTAQERGTVAEVARPETQPPSRYAVLMLNDDFTPMD